MGYSKNKRERKRSKSKDGIGKKLYSYWFQKSPVIIFVAGFCILLALFYLFWQSDFFNDHIQPIIVSANAYLSSRILNSFGMHTTSANEIISSSSFSISVHKGCDAIEAIALFLSTTLAFPMSWRRKFIGMVAGVFVLLIVNIIRIVTLFIAGIYIPDSFEMIHAQIWPAVIIMIATILWILIIRKERSDVQS